MRILHYSLGIPPYRSGGLTKYSMDLMMGQREEGHQVFLLFPGHYSLIGKEPKITSYREHKGIKVFELVNPLPVPLLGGVVNPKEFMKSTNKEIYTRFLQELNPQVIHVHTLMGLHKEFVEAANDLKIKIYFSTHDYYGICPRVNLLKNKETPCSDFQGGAACVNCNLNGYSINTIRVMQSRTYRNLKESSIVKKLRKAKKASYDKEDTGAEENLDNVNNPSLSKDYYNLRQYYIEILKGFTKIHYNSTLSQEIYSSYCKDLKGEVITITHGDIKDNREIKTYDEEKHLRITYLGPVERYKGAYLLGEALSQLYDKGIKNWKLNFYGDNKIIGKYENHENIKFHGRYSQDELKTIFHNSDLVVVPSIWWETFGFITLEAISYGVPVIVTTNVGAKDIVKTSYGIITKPELRDLSNALEGVIENRELLKKFNSNIYHSSFNLDMKNHLEAMLRFYGV